MKIVLDVSVFSEYASEAASAADFVRALPCNDEGIRSAITRFNQILVKLSGFQQEINSETMDGLTDGSSTKELLLIGVEGSLRSMKTAISDRLSAQLDPFTKGEMNPGAETLKSMVRWYAKGKPASGYAIGCVNVSDISRGATLHLSKLYSFDIKLNLFKCSSALGIRKPVAQVARELYSINLEELFRDERQAGGSTHLAEITAALASSLNISQEDVVEGA